MAATDELTSFVVRLPSEQHQRLRELAEVEDRSMASVVRLAIRQYLTAVDEAEDHAPQEAAV